MAFKAYTLTLTGGVQRLSDVFGDGVGVVNAAHDIPFRQLILSPDPVNGNILYIGDDGVSATDHAFALLQGVAANGFLPSMTLGPFETGALKLSDFYVRGTATQRLMIGGVPY